MGIETVALCDGEGVTGRAGQGGVVPGVFPLMGKSLRRNGHYYTAARPPGTPRDEHVIKARSQRELARRNEAVRGLNSK